MFDSDVIVAPATAIGGGGVAIIRISGDGCLNLIQPFIHCSIEFDSIVSHMLYYGSFVDNDGQMIDEIMFVAMFSPRSYTAEDVVEIHCHGNRIIVGRIVDILLEAGARMAQPGEFTQRAFLNGRIDLSSAEAVADVINSRSVLAAKLAVSQLSGSLSQRVFEFRSRIISILSLVEAYIDFPEDDISAPHLLSIETELQCIIKDIENLISRFEEGRILKDGLSVLILGSPNVGKSSILNRFVGEDRAIVTDIPGTTRDVIEESVIVSGIPLRFIDTAGIRETEDPIELDGVRRAKEKISDADLILYVIDGSQKFSLDIESLIAETGNVPLIVVVNKLDIISEGFLSHLDSINHVAVCAKDGRGFESLVDQIGQSFSLVGNEERENILISEKRHRDALFTALQHLYLFLKQLPSDVSPEFLSINLRDALSSLGDITGETTPDDILNNIFSKFCIGK